MSFQNETSMMSDKDDVVLEALERLSKYLTSFCDDVLEYKCDLSLLRLAEKAIAIQKAQARVIEAVRQDTLTEWTPIFMEALAALDEVKKG